LHIANSSDIVNSRMIEMVMLTVGCQELLHCWTIICSVFEEYHVLHAE